MPGLGPASGRPGSKPYFCSGSGTGGMVQIEYGLIATGIALAIIPVITRMGTKLKTTFSAISTAL